MQRPSWTIATLASFLGLVALGSFAACAAEDAPDGDSSAYAPTCGAIAASAVTAIGYEAPNVPGNVVDGDLTTRWSNLGLGSWIQLDLGAPKVVCGLQIAWAWGDQRIATFEVQVSSDATSFSCNTATSGRTTSAPREGPRTES
jgi:hypothetical protein